MPWVPASSYIGEIVPEPVPFAASQVHRTCSPASRDATHRVAPGRAPLRRSSLSQVHWTCSSAIANALAEHSSPSIVRQFFDIVVHRLGWIVVAVAIDQL